MPKIKCEHIDGGNDLEDVGRHERSVCAQRHTEKRSVSHPVRDTRGGQMCLLCSGGESGDLEQICLCQVE